MMGSAELQSEQFDFPAEGFRQGESYDSQTDLKRQVAERLAAHRSRRNRQTGPALVPDAATAPQPARKRSNSIAAAVAERYAHSQSYRDFLAAEAERAIDQANRAAEEAEATAHVAARSAQAIVFAQQQLLEELENWNSPPIQEWSRTDLNHPEGDLDVTERGSDTQQAYSSTRHAVAQEVFAIPQPMPVSPADLTVRLYEDLVERQPRASVLHRSDMPTNAMENSIDPEESYVLDEEIEFRQAPVFEEIVPPVAIPANLIEFPRQLIASRKARPRIAEGPLREESESASASTQLRIFEVEPAQISTQPIAEHEAVAPVWSSILLDAAPVVHVMPEIEAKVLPPMQVAPLNLRLMAGIVDLCAVGVTFLAGATAFALWTNVLPTGLSAAATAVGAFATLFVLYHLLFFTFSEATPGMSYARIGLCTFDDENPTRSQMRRRTWAVLLASFPLGLGLLWAWFDGEGLGWHDRLSRMYQRHY
jgi:hypothetical protein